MTKEELEKENAELKGERTFILELTETELEELDSVTYEMSSHERHEAMIHARDMDKNIHSLRAKVITLVNKVRFEKASLKEAEQFLKEEN